MLQVNYQFAMDAEHAVMLLDPRRAEDGSTSGQAAARPDTTARIKHIDATAERLDDKMHRLERMRYLEDED